MGYTISSTTNSSSLTMTMTFTTGISSSTATATVTTATTTTTATAALSTSDPILFLTHRKALRARRDSEHIKRRATLLVCEGSDAKFTTPRLSRASSSSSSAALYKENVIMEPEHILKSIGRGETLTRANSLSPSSPILSPSSSKRLSLPTSPRPTRPAPLPPTQFSLNTLTNSPPISASASEAEPEQLKSEIDNDVESESSMQLNFVKSPTSPSFPLSLSHPFRPRPRLISRSRSPSPAPTFSRHGMRNGNNASERTWTYVRKPSPLCPSSSFPSHAKPHSPSQPRTVSVRPHTKPHLKLTTKPHSPSLSQSKPRSSRDPCLLRLAIMTNMRRSESGRQVLAMGARRAMAMFEAMEDLERICGDEDEDDGDVDGDVDAGADERSEEVSEEGSKVRIEDPIGVVIGLEHAKNGAMAFEVQQPTHKPWARWDNFSGFDCEDEDHI